MTKNMPKPPAPSKEKKFGILKTKPNKNKSGLSPTKESFDDTSTKK